MESRQKVQWLFAQPTTGRQSAKEIATMLSGGSTTKKRVAEGNLVDTLPENSLLGVHPSYYRK